MKIIKYLIEKFENANPETQFLISCVFSSIIILLVMTLFIVLAYR